jgi:phosphoenolpyruvate-protein phosphotransferase
MINGICGSKGKAIGTAVLVAFAEEKNEKYVITDYAAEEQRFREAQKKYETRLAGLYEKCMAETGEQEALIFKAYSDILLDEVFFAKVLANVKNEMINVEHAIQDEYQKVERIFAQMDDPYLQERANDIVNVCATLIDMLMGREKDFLAAMADIDDVIIVAEDLTPADTIRMDRSRLRGFVTEKGGITSHVAILAKALGIPTIVGARGALKEISHGDTLLLDATNGVVFSNPDKDKTDAFIAEKEDEDARALLYASCETKPAVTKDGVLLHINVNTGDTESLKEFDAERCDGIGLLRTEFLYLGRHSSPEEDYQFEVYKNIAVKAGGKEVIIRTLDIGGDKKADYMDIETEENPFLGFRAIRLCLGQPEMFRTQLRAILRASAYGNIKIMFPMIVTLEELREAKAMLCRAKAELDARGEKYNADIETGIMIETPAAVVISDLLAAESDFFSIGTNDLVQYTVAADRTNNKVQYLYDICNVSVLRSIKKAADEAAKAGIPIGICGEAASYEELVPLWVALGIDELSVAASLVGSVKYIVQNSEKARLEGLAADVFSKKTSQEIRDELKKLAVI